MPACTKTGQNFNPNIKLLTALLAKIKKRAKFLKIIFFMAIAQWLEHKTRN